MNVLDQKKEMCLSFDTPPFLYPFLNIYEINKANRQLLSFHFIKN